MDKIFESVLLASLPYTASSRVVKALYVFVHLNVSCLALAVVRFPAKLSRTAEVQHDSLASVTSHHKRITRTSHHQRRASLRHLVDALKSARHLRISPATTVRTLNMRATTMGDDLLLGSFSLGTRRISEEILHESGFGVI